MKRIIQKFWCTKGSSYVSDSFGMLMMMLSLVLIISVAPVLKDISTVDRMANQVSRYIEVQGDIGSAESEFRRIQGIMKTKGTTSMSIDANTMGSTSRIQMDDEFTVTITYNGSFDIGGIINKAFVIPRKSTGRSEHYWK